MGAGRFFPWEARGPWDRRCSRVSHTAGQPSQACALPAGPLRLPGATHVCRQPTPLPISLESQQGVG